MGRLASASNKATAVSPSLAGVPTIKEWLCRELPAGSRVGIDPYVHTLFEASELKAALEEAGKILVSVHGFVLQRVNGGTTL